MPLTRTQLRSRIKIDEFCSSTGYNRHIVYRFIRGQDNHKLERALREYVQALKKHRISQIQLLRTED